MKYYQEVTLLKNEEFHLYELWSQLYLQLHLALVEIKDFEEKTVIGLSFPEYHHDASIKIGFLGTKCRLFAQDEETLIQLNISRWLNRLANHVYCTDILTVPSVINGYAFYQKVNKKTNLERQARRHAKRNNISFDQAMEKYADFEPFESNFPFVQIKSLSSQQSFKLFIEKKQHSELKFKKFNTYGLSSASTLPEF